MLAGRGHGKTRALTARIAHLIATGTARPNEILAVTFTNKAAREMKMRVGRFWARGRGDALAGHVPRHRREAPAPARRTGRAETELHHPGHRRPDPPAQAGDRRPSTSTKNAGPRGSWPAIIDGWKNRAWRPESVPAAEAGAYNNRGTELYAAYQERLRTLNACDFGDLLLHMVTIFQTHPDVLAQYQRWLRFILVDEYQDTNVAQYLWLRLLAGGHQEHLLRGRRRSVDLWLARRRGGQHPAVRARFSRRAGDPAGAELPLDPAYPGAASKVIAGNEGRLGKTLWTEAEAGEKVRLIGHWDGEEEARWIGDEIEALERGRAGCAAVAQRHGDPGARQPPDARLRGPVPDHRPALPRDRRPALL
jgi:DNA helicase II / ATP-dependent DNA helicase PcrA